MKVDVLIEIMKSAEEAFGAFSFAASTETEAERQAESLVADMSGFGLEVVADFEPIPLFSEKTVADEEMGFAAFSAPTENPDVASESIIVAAQVESSKLADLESEHNVIVWPNPELFLYDPDSDHPFDLARSDGGLDCRPFRPGVSIDIIRQLLGVDALWNDGFRGQNIVVGIIDEGVNGDEYPVVGGFSRPNKPRPGSAGIDSHGSMCAADVLVAAPAAKIYDYPFLGIPNSGGALRMFQAVLQQRRIDGTPHLTTNSYGFFGRPPQGISPNHPVWNINHPTHRKIREVVASGAPTFFAAGNCGEPCPSGRCASGSTGPGDSIHGSNSLAEVITIAAVNSRHERIGYSSQGPGGFEHEKPDVAAYSHLFGNFGPGRPAGLSSSFDSGTSAATPVAAGVGAVLLSAFPNLLPDDLKAALIDSAYSIGSEPDWNPDTGNGVINAAAAYSHLR